MGTASVARRRVLFLGHGAERTGPPILLGHLLAGLAPRGDWDCSVLVARDGPLTARYRAAGARVKAVTAAREPLEPMAAALRRMGLGDAGAAIQRRRRAGAARGLGAVDLVYVNAATPSTAALLRALDLAPTTPVVLHVHELDVGLRHNLDPSDLRFLLDRADHLISASGAVTDNLVEGHGVSPRSITTCDVFVDVSTLHPRPRAQARHRLGVPADVPLVGSVGLPDWRKDPEHLLRAIARLADRPGGPPWVAWIGGDADSTDGRHLADEARRLGLVDTVVHLGHQDDPSQLLGGLDVFALPAREDALPLAALEAAAVGLPLVCFRTGGVAALCDQGAGLAVDYPDTVAFADALAHYLDDPAARAAAGTRGRTIIRDHHDLDHGVARITSALDRLVPTCADPRVNRYPGPHG